MTMATLSAGFRITIPKNVRDAQRGKAGQDFVFLGKGKRVLVMPVPKRADLLAIAKGARQAGQDTGYRDRDDRY